MKSWLFVATLAWGLAIHPADAADGARTFTANDLNSLARISDPQVSPNGRYVVYVQRETDLDAQSLWRGNQRLRAASADLHRGLGRSRPVDEHGNERRR